MRVAVVGNGILANLAVLYFRRRLPTSAEVVRIGPQSRGGMPVVGESTIEITTQFLENELGLGQYLRQNHFPKYALTYYFKLDPTDPEDRTYSVHCNVGKPNDLGPLPGWDGPMARPPAWQLNRETFDRDLRAMVAEQDGIERIEGMVKGVDVDGESGHTLTIDAEDGETRSMTADWVIDASGRKRLLAKKLGLVIKPEGQRDCFWFRLADFDRSLLTELTALGDTPPGLGEPYHYDRHFSTHHFMGKGNWIWLIPMRTEDDSELISIGIVSRPDVYEHDVRSIDDFLEHVGAVHPVVTDLVKSGRVVDTNILRRYHYVTDPVYSPDRWALVGDAAFAPDPLFSNGLAFGTMQLQQIGQMISDDCEGSLSADTVNALSKGFLAIVLGSQSVITNWYKTMEDAFLSSVRLMWIDIAYFYMILPLVVNRCHFDPKRTGLWNLLLLASGQNDFELPQPFVDARKTFDQVTPEHFVYTGTRKVNERALERVDDLRGVSQQIEAGARLRTEYMQEVLARVAELAEGEQRRAG